MENRGNRNPFSRRNRDPFSGGFASAFGGFGDTFPGFGGFDDAFGGFGGGSSILSSVFSGRNPFDDPFFSQPFGAMHGPSLLGQSGSPFAGIPGPSPFGPYGGPFGEIAASAYSEHQTPQPGKPRGPVIEEIPSDDEEEDVNKNIGNPKKLRKTTMKPYVEHPDDEGEERKRKSVQHTYNNAYSNSNTKSRAVSLSQPQTSSFSFQSSTVMRTGGNGECYTFSTNRRTGSDGLCFEEIKEADTSSRKAMHKISKGIHDKGHSVVRKLKSDGEVEKLQILHNLGDDEVNGFEDAWNARAGKMDPGLLGEQIGNGESCRGVRALPCPSMQMRGPDFQMRKK